MKAVLKKEYTPDIGKVKDHIINYWNGRSDSFMRQRDEELHSQQHRIWEQELIAQLPADRKLKILDVGCGCGFFSLILAEQGHDVTGIDLTGGMILRARELAKEYEQYANFYRMDAENLNFPDETFDAVVTRNLTWTLPHPDRAYRQWIRVLKPGGILLNYDAEHARYHRNQGLEQEEAHKMLSRGQMDECMRIYDMLPISEWKRPDWDMMFLHHAGCADVSVDEQIGQRLFPNDDQFRTPYPVFRIKAVKKNR